MKKYLALSLVFASSLAVGWATAPQTAECRMCQSKTCNRDRDCGKYCTCVWPDGKDYKRGICVRMGDGD